MRESLGGSADLEHPRKVGTRVGKWGWRQGRGPLPRSGEGSGNQAGITLTSTSMRWSPPPKITPRSGTTSAKSAPQASVM